MQVVASTGWLDPQEDEFTWPAGARAGDVAVVVSFGQHYNGPDGFVQQGQTLRRSGRLGKSSVYVVYTRVLGAGFDDAPPWTRWGLRRQAAMVILRDTTGVGRVRVNDGRAPVRAFGGGLILTSPPAAGSALPAGWSWSAVATEPEAFGAGPFHAAWGWAEAASDGTLGSVLDYPSVVVELLPPQGPGQPVITNPTSGEISNAGTVELSWQHRPSIQGGYQDRVQVRRESDDGAEYWTGSAWSVSAATLYTSEQTLDLDGSGFVTGAPYLLTVRTREGLDGQWSDWSAPVEVVTVTPPTVTVTAPAGTVHNNLRPVVSWSASTPRGVQTAYRVRVVTSLGVQVHDSGWRQGDATEFILPSLDWANGGAYQVLVQVAQTGGSASDYGTTDFTTTWDTPTVPTVTATPGADGVAVAVAADPFMRLQVQRIRPDGTWADLTTTTIPDSAATFAWTGTPGASTSTMSRDGVVVRTNLNNYESPGGFTARGNATLTPGVMWDGDEWVQVDVTSNGHGTRTRANAADLTDGATYTWALEVANPSVSAVTIMRVQWVDSGALEDFVLAPGQRRVIRTSGSRATYDSTWCFGDTGAGAGERYLVRKGTIEEGVSTRAPFDGDSQPAPPDMGLIDPFAPFGRPTAYRARAATILDGQPMWSAWGTSDPVTPVHKLAYLASAVDPARTWQPLLIVDDSEHTRQTPTAVAYGLGDDRPRVTHGIYRGRTGTLTLTAGHDDEQAITDLIDLLECGEPLILRWPAEGAGDSIIDAGTLTFSVADSLTTARRAQVAVLRGRRIQVPWVEQETPPLGASNAPITHPIEGETP